MRRSLRFVIITLALVMIAQRSPAPIVEEAETPKPTPAAEQEAPKPRRENRETSQSNKAPRPTAPQDRFVGTWTGKISQGIVGDVVFTLTFAAGGAQVTEHSSFGTYTHPTTSNSQSTTWKTGLLNDITWTFAPNADGNSAQVTAKSSLPLGANGNAVFHRGGTPAVVKPTSEFPVAKPVPERPGFVYNPFDPTSRIFIDVRDKPSGTKLVDPKSGKTFVVP